MPAAIKRTHLQDRRGRTWTVSVVPKAQNRSEDARFWYEELTPAQRVDLVASACSTASRPRESSSYPDFEEFIAALNARRVRYLVIGAYAFAFHAKPRPPRISTFTWSPRPRTRSGSRRRSATSSGARLPATRMPILDPDNVIQLGVAPVRIDILSSVSGIESFGAAWRGRAEGSLRARRGALPRVRRPRSQQEGCEPPAGPSRSGSPPASQASAIAPGELHMNRSFVVLVLLAACAPQASQAPAAGPTVPAAGDDGERRVQPDTASLGLRRPLVSRRRRVRRVARQSGWAEAVRQRREAALARVRRRCPRPRPRARPCSPSEPSTTSSRPSRGTRRSSVPLAGNVSDVGISINPCAATRSRRCTTQACPSTLCRAPAHTCRRRPGELLAPRRRFGERRAGPQGEAAGPCRQRCLLVDGCALPAPAAPVSGDPRTCRPRADLARRGRRGTTRPETGRPRRPAMSMLSRLEIGTASVSAARSPRQLFEILRRRVARRSAGPSSAPAPAEAMPWPWAAGVARASLGRHDRVREIDASSATPCFHQDPGLLPCSPASCPWWPTGRNAGDGECVRTCEPSAGH